MARFVLVHGSCHGAWCWRDVVPVLEALGHEAVAIDLPSHGEDPTHYSAVTAQMYRDAVLAACTKRSIVVGHSMAGFPIAHAADTAPERIARLVFLCAYAPISGTSLVQMRAIAKRQLILDAIEKTEDGLAWQPIAGKARGVFYHDVPHEAYLFAKARLRPQAIKPQATQLDLSASYAAVPKSYIKCSEDRTIDPDFQTEMMAGFAADDRYTLATSHSPFFADPKGLATLLDKIAQAG